MFDGSNSELRQKLINLMYLVFITLAFIYLPSDFIDSSKYIQKSFAQSEEEYTTIIQEKQGYLDEQLYLNTPLAQDYYNIMQVSSEIDSTTKHINRMMNAIRTEVGGYDEYGFLNSSKNFLIASRIMVDAGEASILNSQIEKIKQNIKAYNLKSIIPFIDTLLPSSVDLKSSGGKDKTWETFFFSKTPLAVVNTNLQKIKTDLAYIKLKLVEYLVGNGSNGKSDKSVSILSSNSIAVEILAAKNFILGDKVAFKVVLLDSAGEGSGKGKGKGNGYGGVKSYIKKGNSIVKQLKIKDGGIISYTANETGTFQLVVENDSAVITKQNFVVTNLRTAYTEKNSPEIMYMGVDNPIQIQASNLDINSIQTEIDMGEVIPFGGKYYLRFQSEGIAHLKIYSTNADGRYLVVEKSYRVKKLPSPVVTIDSKSGGSISQKILQVQDKLVAQAEDINVTGVYNILSFEVSRIQQRDRETVVNRGDIFGYETRKMLKETNSGDLVVIDNIKVKATDGTLKEVNPVVFRVK